MARYKFTVEIAGVETLEADAFATQLRAMGRVVSVDSLEDGVDVPLFPPFEVIHKKLNSVWKGWVICTREFVEYEEKMGTLPFLPGDKDREYYEYSVDECGGVLDPAKLRSEDLVEYAQACYMWAKICMRVTGCTPQGIYETQEAAVAALPVLNWAVRNPGMDTIQYRGF